MEGVIITPHLSRAARALLDWQQNDLADAAGLSLTAVKAFENGSDKTRAATKGSIQNALETGGIEFLASGGLRRVDEISTMTRLTGPDFIVKFYNDIYAACAGQKTELLASSTEQKIWWHPSILEQQYAFEAWLKRSQTVMRSLIPKGAPMSQQPTALYRSVPKEMLGKVNYCLYADRLAFLLWKKRQVLILRNASIVETFRGQFDYLWRLGQSVSKPPAPPQPPSPKRRADR